MTSHLTPFATFDAIWNQLSPFHAMPPAERDGDNAMPTLQPAVTIHEGETEFIIQADLPGVTKDDLKVEVEKNQLTIRGTRQGQELKHTAVHVERYDRVSFERTFLLGSDINAEGIRAQLQDGVLTLTLPKAEKALPRRIDVR